MFGQTAISPFDRTNLIEALKVHAKYEKKNNQQEEQKNITHSIFPFQSTVFSVA